ncbi:MAG: hypothetical protein Q7U18_02340 [Methylobacter sp.]|nr:hypothetical protein [Methylobacter sp.]
MSAFIKYPIAVLALFSMVMTVDAKNIEQNRTTEQPPAGVLFDIPKLAGKTQAEVEVLLGEPVFCAKSESALNCSFQEDEIEIVFIDGKADWITVNGAFRSPAYSQKVEGKTKAEALALLGDPVFCVKEQSALHCSFKDGDVSVSVEFIDGKVSETTVKGSLANAPYSKETLAMLGLTVKDASFSNEHVMRWDNIPGLLSVMLHSEGKTVSVATIKVKTK